MNTPYMRGWHAALRDWSRDEASDDLSPEDYASNAVDDGSEIEFDELVEEGRGYAAAVKMNRASKITGGGANLNGFGR
jgi:hypothetical protein